VKQAGQIVLFRFPQTDLEQGKLRPALLLGKLPGEYDDWLICMISSQIRHCVPGFDEVVQETDTDFTASGLKLPSVVRVGRLAVIEGEMLLGAIGQIAPERLQRIKSQLAEWLTSL
jgi:mRNA interferase MazF